MSFMRVVITCQPVYKTHVSAIFIPRSSTIRRGAVLKELQTTVKILPYLAAVDIANFTDYRPSCASSVLHLRIGSVSIHWSDQRAMGNSGTLVAFGIGRFISAWLMRSVAPTKLLGSYAMVNVALVGFAMLRPSWAGLWALFATSFFKSLMFPTIFALGLKGLGPNTKFGGSLIVMAIVGGAILTPLMGLIAETHHTIAPACIDPLAVYVVIAEYAFLGAQARGVANTAGHQFPG